MYYLKFVAVEQSSFICVTFVVCQSGRARIFSVSRILFCRICEVSFTFCSIPLIYFVMFTNTNLLFCIITFSIKLCLALVFAYFEFNCIQKLLNSMVNVMLTDNVSVRVVLLDVSCCFKQFLFSPCRAAFLLSNAKKYRRTQQCRR